LNDCRFLVFSQCGTVMHPGFLNEDKNLWLVKVEYEIKEFETLPRGKKRVFRAALHFGRCWPREPLCPESFLNHTQPTRACGGQHQVRWG
jgi:hypothetical protein